MNTPLPDLPKRWTPRTTKATASNLYHYHRLEYSYASATDKKKFERRVRKCAEHVNPQAAEGDDVHSVMYLDVIATRLGIDLEYGGKI